MAPKVINKIIDECEQLLDTIPIQKLTVWNFFRKVNDIVGLHKGIECLINVTIYNGNIVKALCVITDWKPGALVFQSDEGEPPKMRLVYPEEYVAFMEKVMPIFDTTYPPIPEDQLSEE